MPGKRAPGQKLIGTRADQELHAAVVRAAGRGKTISDFVREALVEKIQSMGIAIDPNLKFPPPRATMIAETHGDYSPVTQKHTTFSSASGVPASKPTKYPRVKKKKQGSGDGKKKK